MQLSIPFLLVLASTILAQRPQNISICDYYTPQILGPSTPTTQHLLIALLINTVVLGNYTTPNVGVKVDGFAAPNEYNGTKIDLLYVSFASTFFIALLCLT